MDIIPKFISGTFLMKRWELNEVEVLQLIKESGIKEYQAEGNGRFSVRVDYGDSFLMPLMEWRYFKTSDILELEKKNEASPNPQFALLKEGKTWRMIYDGNPFAGLKGKGFSYIGVLVSNSGKEFSSDELERIAGQTIEPVFLDTTESRENSELVSDNIVYDFSPQNKADKTTIEEIRKKRRELKVELEKAKRLFDYPLIKEIEGEIGEIEKFASDYETPFGTPTAFRSAVNKTKDRVSKNVERALKQLKELDQAAYLHFDNAIKGKYSNRKSYLPDREIDWLIQ